jgi:hypothetical protein
VRVFEDTLDESKTKRNRILSETSDSRRQSHGMAMYGKTNKKTATNNVYLGKDPVGPLAPLGGTESPTPTPNLNH